MGIEEFLEKHHLELKAYPHVLNVRLNTKWVGGVDTLEPCIRVYVDHKLPLDQLKPEEVIPPTLAEGAGPVSIPPGVNFYKTDVVEWRPDTWTAGVTEMSKKSPKEQDRMLGAIINHPATITTHMATSYAKDWEPQNTPVRNQASCGICVGFGVCGSAWQDNLAILEGQVLVLSVQYPFFCVGGTCGTGTTPEAVLGFCVSNGDALEDDDPYVSGNGVDEPCGYGLNPTWYLRGKKLAAYQTLTDKTAMKVALMNAPLVTTMNVYESFMNYVNGKYHNLGVLDPLMGGHCIEAAGVDDVNQCWKGKNSWGIGWGCSGPLPGTPGGGYFYIAYSDSNFDDQMYPIVLSDTPPSPPAPPGPTPSPCPYGKAVAKVMSFFPWLLHRKGRFAYQNPGK